jgi:hypothetical protein
MYLEINKINLYRKKFFIIFNSNKISGQISNTQINDLQDFILEKKIAAKEDVNGLVAKEKTISYFLFLNRK